MSDDDRAYVGTVSRIVGISDEWARRLMDDKRFGPVQRDALGYRYVSRQAVEAFVKARARRERVGGRR